MPDAYFRLLLCILGGCKNCHNWWCNIKLKRSPVLLNRFRETQAKHEMLKKNFAQWLFFSNICSSGSSLRQHTNPSFSISVQNIQSVSTVSWGLERWVVKVGSGWVTERLTNRGWNEFPLHESMRGWSPWEDTLIFLAEFLFHFKYTGILRDSGLQQVAAVRLEAVGKITKAL